MMNESTIQADGLTRRFGDFTAVDQISFKVRKGEVFGFLGANGAGKTTAIKMLTGLLSPTEGQASIAGYDVYTQSEQIRQTIGYMSQKFSLYDDLTVKENITFYGGVYGLDDSRLKSRMEEVLKSLDITSYGEKLVKALPLGWKQKLAFSIALIHEPRIVFMDEPTGGVDPVTRRAFWEKIYEVADRGITVFVTTHYMDEAEYCDRVSIMVDGRIEALDTPDGLKESYKASSMEEVFIQLARNAVRGAG